MSYLKNKVAIVTGASSGIGKASALALAANGVKVVGAALDEDQLDAVVAEIKAAGGKATSRVTNVADGEDAKALGALLGMLTDRSTSSSTTPA